MVNPFEKLRKVLEKRVFFPGKIEKQELKTEKLEEQKVPPPIKIPETPIEEQFFKEARRNNPNGTPEEIQRDARRFQEGTRLTQQREKEKAQGIAAQPEQVNRTTAEVQARVAAGEQIVQELQRPLPVDTAQFKGGGILGAATNLFTSPKALATGAAGIGLIKGAAAGGAALGLSGGAAAAIPIGIAGFFFKAEAKEFLTNRQKIADVIGVMPEVRNQVANLPKNVELGLMDSRDALLVLANTENEISAMEEQLRLLVASSATFKTNTDSYDLEFALDQTRTAAAQARAELINLTLQRRLGITQEEAQQFQQ